MANQNCAQLILLSLFALSVLRSSLSAVANHHHAGGGQRERTHDGAFSPLDDRYHRNGQGDHSTAFDHEAILGSVKEAEEFDHLPPKEAKAKLRVLVEKMDRNGDGKVEKRELFSWILRSFRSLSEEESDERFKDTDDNNDGFITWEEYKSEEFDLEDDEDEKSIAMDPEKLEELNMLQEDKILFTAADANNDGKLDKVEFLSFSHPEEDPKMIQPVVDQTKKSKDADGDGKISFQEYIGQQGVDQTKEWLLAEKDRFDNDLDKNRDGQLDDQEIGMWIIPSNDQIAEDEVNHLFAGSDDDMDGLLSVDEILDHHDLFVGSEATDYGEHLRNPQRFDDEL